MLRVILVSLAALVVVAIVMHSSGLTPGEAERQLLLAELNAEEGAAYRNANRLRPGVLALPDDLQVEVLELGDGAQPHGDDWVQVHYRAAHIDGRVFEDSRRGGEPATVPVNRTIAGWQRVLVDTPVGSRLRLVIPPALAYGRGGGGPVGPEETLVFEIELLAIVPAPESPATERDPLQQAVPGLSG